MQYQRIILEGFGSFCKPRIFILGRGAGIFLIKGINGKGKSTIWRALGWCEFGKHENKTLESWTETRDENYRGTRVIVERTDGEFDYRIARHYKFKGTTLGLEGKDRLMIFRKRVDEPKFVKEHLIGEELDKDGMTGYKLGTDYKTFMSSLIMQQKADGLVKMKNEDKRKMLDKLFSLLFLDDAKANGKKMREELEQDLDKMKNKSELLSSKIDLIIEYLEEQEQAQAEYASKHKKRVEEQKAKIKKSKESYSDKVQEIEELKAWLEEHSLEERKGTNINDLLAIETRLLNKESELESEVRKCKRELEEAKENKAKYEVELKNVKTTCPYCERDLLKRKVNNVKKQIKLNIEKEKDVEASMSKRLDKAKADLKTTREELEQASKNVKELQAKIDKVNDSRQEYYKKEGKLESSAEHLAELEQGVKGAETKLKELESEKMKTVDLQPKKDEQAKLEEELSTVEETKTKISNKLEKVNWWMKKGFGASGIRAYVFNAMLGKLNEYAQYYAARLGFGVEFSVDLSKATAPFKTIVYRGDSVKHYDDLSGGQKQRADLCLMFAMNDIVREQCNTNIFVIDEGFDGLDQEGKEAAFDLIRLKSQTQTVYVISHSDILDEFNCKNIYVTADALGSSVVTG